MTYHQTAFWTTKYSALRLGNSKLNLQILFLSYYPKEKYIESGLRYIRDGCSYEGGGISDVQKQHYNTKNNDLNVNNNVNRTRKRHVSNFNQTKILDIFNLKSSESCTLQGTSHKLT